jgi:uncharacterized membrane protein YeaQ/YmgE (transglycosylase-associated protein family)
MIGWLICGKYLELISKTTINKGGNMGLIITMIVISVIAGIAGGLYDYKNDNSFWSGFIWLTRFCSIVGALICIFIFCISYCTNIGLMQWKAELENVRRPALDIYSSYANVPLGAHNKIVSDLTDKKYEGFQNNLYSALEELTTVSKHYNNRLISKRTYKNTWFWGALIVFPEDPGIYKLQ